jgi:hypothetical protein
VMRQSWCHLYGVNLPHHFPDDFTSRSKM